MSVSKDEMSKMFERQRELLRPEADMHESLIAMTELLMTFFDYIDERRDEFEQHLLRKKEAR